MDTLCHLSVWVHLVMIANPKIADLAVDENSFSPLSLYKLLRKSADFEIKYKQSLECRRLVLLFKGQQLVLQLLPSHENEKNR